MSYLEAYPLNGYSIYGAVPIREIKRTLLALRSAGRLDQVKILLLQRVPRQLPDGGRFRYAGG